MSDTIKTSVRFASGNADCSLELPAVWRFASPRRGYEMSIELDLLGGFWLVRRWWGLFNRRGSSKRQQFGDLMQAIAFAQSVVRRRQRHGYEVLGAPNMSTSQVISPAQRQQPAALVASGLLQRLRKKEAPRTKSRQPAEKKEAQLSLL